MMRIKIFLPYLVFFVFAGMSDTQAGPMHLDSVKIHLPFYGNLNDWSGWNNNGQSMHQVSGIDRYGNPSRAFHIPDSLHFFRVPTKNIQLPIFTYAQWVQLDEMPGPEGATVFEGGADSCTHSLRLLPKAQDSLWMEYRLPFGDADTVLLFPVRMPLNSWHHLTALRSRDSVFLYFDVLFNAGFYVPGEVCHQGAWLNYGAARDSTRVLIGSLDEVRVFSENIEPSLLFDIVTGERLSNGSQEQVRLNIYPNPGKDHCFIDSEKNLRSVIVRDLQGKLLFLRDELDSPWVECRHMLEPGIYLLEVEFDNRERKVLRFLVR